jgi:hypothetical protein
MKQVDVFQIKHHVNLVYHKSIISRVWTEGWDMQRTSDAKGCKNDDGKPIPCYRHGILGSGGHDNRCHYLGPPFHPCGFQRFQFIHGKCIKNIFINIHTHTSGGSSGSNNLSDES